MTSASKATVPEFEFSVSPTSVLVEQVMPIQIQVLNSTGGDLEVDIDLSVTVIVPVGDGAEDLIAPDTQSEVTASVTDTNWTTHVTPATDAVTVLAAPSRAYTWVEGDFLDIVINDITVNGTVSSDGAAITVQAAVGSEQGEIKTLSVAKVESGMDISAYADPQAVGATQTTRIWWTATGGATVSLTGNGEDQSEPLEGEGPVWSGAFTVEPNQSAPQTTYTVTVSSAGGSDSKDILAVVDLRPPAINSFTVDPPDNIDIGAPVTLRWDSSYGTDAILMPGMAVPVDSDGLTYKPEEYVGDNPDDLTVTLSVNAPGQESAQAPLTLTFAPAEIVYFSYSSEDPQDGVKTPVVINDQDNKLTISGDVHTLDVTGPGGPLQRTIGADAPEVRYFGPYGLSVAAGSTIALNYWVNGFKPDSDTVRLQPGDIELTVDSEGKGSVDVTVTEPTDYTLQATLSGVQIDNTFTITIKDL